MKQTSPLPRRYVQQRRARSTAETGVRIVAAAMELFLASGAIPTLDGVAERAGVTVQTILRRFGSKEGLFAACVAEGQAEVATARGAVTPGDVPGAVDNLLAHYDAWGDRSLRLLWHAEHSPAAARVVADGRALHRAWVERAFGPLLADLPDDERRVRLAQLVTVTDVYAWKLLHRDQGLSRDDTRCAVLGLLAAALPSPTRSPR